MMIYNTLPLGAIGPIGTISVAALYVILLVVALVLIMRRETGWARPLWVLIELFVPFAGSLAYYVNYFIKTPKRA